MVKYFSVDWLSQSDATPEQLEVNAIPSTQVRPHVPCVVQPRQPTSFDKAYLKPKPKLNKTVDVPAAVGQTEQEAVANVVGHPVDCSSPISEISGYSSGYESEAASSEWPSMEDGGEADQEANQRRVRTKFTPEQIQKLEKIFSKHKYLDAGERAKTAVKLNLSETQVRTWFQNRRMKVKREVQDLRAGYLAPVLPAMMYPAGSSVLYSGYKGQQMLVDPAVTGMFYPSVGHQLPVQQMMPQPIHNLMTPAYYY